MRAIENARNAGGEMECKLVYTGREDDETLEDSLFSDLGIRKPDVYLGVECENMNELTGMVMAQFERYLQQNPTDVVIVVDDLVSTMAVSIVTKKQGVQLAHIAAGTRSFDITMPKEINRLVIDGLSDILFTAGISNNSIANKEGAELSKVYMVGNVLIDNIRFLQQRMKRPQVMDEQHLEDGEYGVEQLAHDLCMERTGLYKKLTTLTDTTPVALIRSVRLRRAAALLQEGTLTVNEIAERTGFSSPSYFTKCFKKEFGVLPSEYM